MTTIWDLSSLQKCADSLAEAVKIFEKKEWFESQSQEVQSLLLAGEVKTFEYAYESSTKLIKRFVESSSLNPAEVDRLDFRDTLRIAWEMGLIETVEKWFEFRKLRNTTAHTYDENKAEVVSNSCGELLKSIQFLLSQLESRNAKTH